MPNRLTTQEKVNLILQYGRYESATAMQRHYSLQTEREAPSRKAILSLVKRFKKTGSVGNLKSTGKFNPRTGNLWLMTAVTHFIKLVLGLLTVICCKYFRC